MITLKDMHEQKGVKLGQRYLLISEPSAVCKIADVKLGGIHYTMVRRIEVCI